MKKKISALIITSFLLLLKANAQIPKEVPHPDDNKPLDLSNPSEVIIYIIIPLLFIVLFFIWRNKRKKNK